MKIVQFGEGNFLRGFVGHAIQDDPEVIKCFQKCWKEDSLKKTVNSLLSNITLWDINLS